MFKVYVIVSLRHERKQPQASYIIIHGGCAERGAGKGGWTVFYLAMVLCDNPTAPTTGTSRIDHQNESKHYSLQRPDLLKLFPQC